MWHTYVIRSINQKLLYIGSTNNIKRRLNEHNTGKSASTSPYKPFELICCISLNTEKKARCLEKYFKTGSGKTILKKRILNDKDLAKHKVQSET
ncbi:GIY-YIG nuclease family protein [Candidatus Peregrinibacteria bacterium]|jgi:putative endonuclease|nr:GIY-YIG nuclease family protein [Candidatus Peregrinibacteria bacterium]